MDCLSKTKPGMIHFEEEIGQREMACVLINHSRKRVALHQCLELTKCQPSRSALLVIIVVVILNWN